jgi:hypothetical protein
MTMSVSRVMKFFDAAGDRTIERTVAVDGHRTGRMNL